MLDHAAVEQAEKSLDEFINSRSKQREEANAVEALWRTSERVHAAKRREENKTLWFTYYSQLAHSCRQRAEEYEARAEALLVNQPKGETA